MTSTVTTVVGWSLILAVGGVSYWQYRSSQDRRPGGRPAQGDRQRGGSKDRRRKVVEVQEVDNEPAAASNDQVKNRKRKEKKEKQGSPAVDPAPVTARELPRSSAKKEKETDDVAFAQQLASTQSGTTLRAPDRTSQRVRTNKVKTGKQAEGGWQSSGTSSAAASPSLGAAAVDVSDPTEVDDIFASGQPDTTGGLDDMLEAPAPGPASLRITPSEKPQREQIARKPKAQPEEETKKQRQRRKRREIEKEAAAEAEAKRRQLLEQQLKTARTAEGTAKSGQYRTYTPPATNAWASTPAPAAGVAEPAKVAPVGNAGLLDTFEVDDSTPATTTVPGTIPATNGAATTTASGSGDESGPSLDSEPASSAAGSIGGGHAEPVILGNAASGTDAAGNHSDAWEDYQLRTIKQRETDNGGWEEVPRKGKKKGTKA